MIEIIINLLTILPAQGIPNPGIANFNNQVQKSDSIL